MLGPSMGRDSGRDPALTPGSVSQGEGSESVQMGTLWPARRVPLGVSRSAAQPGAMTSIPPHVLPAEHNAIAMGVWTPFGSLTYDVYCPRCCVFLARCLRGQSAAIRLAGTHRFEYGLPTLKYIETECIGYNTEDEGLF